MEETRLTKLTLTNPSQASSAEPMQQNQNTQSKKLYFKQSATEALHSAILLKARNPLGSDLQQQQQQQQQQTSIINNTKLFKSNAEANKILCPKLANANTLLTISSTANSSQILNNINNLDNANSNNSNLIDSNQTNSENNNNNNNNNNHMSFDELAELDSPLKIKENILASIRNLKPALIGLDPLRSSTSDDEDSHSDNIERKFKTFTKTNQNEATAMDSSPAESEVIILSQNQNLKSNIQLKPQQQQTQFTLLKQPQQRHIYLRANSTNTAGTKTLTKLPNFASNLSIAAASQLNSNSTVISTPVLINKTGQLSKIQLSRATSKRGKEEALSNSSSSDEEEQKETCILPTNLKIVNSTSQPSFVSNNSSFKLQQLILNPNKPQAPTTSTPIQHKQIDTNKNALLALNQPPHITPVVNSAAAAAALAAAQASNASNTNITPVVSQSILSTSSSSSSASSSPSSANLNSSESDLVSSASSSPSSLSFKSQKSSIDHEYTNSSLSAASPTSCCSSSATNDVGIDLHDDNSSTASEPTYARQPGFEHHAHEVVVMQKLPTTPKSLVNVNTNKTMLNKLKKGETCSSLLKQQQTNGPKSTNKAKKKLCMMNSDVANLNVGISGGEVSGNELNDRQNVQLKPISNKAKREPLPMRLRALPMSFWQQPNQPNVSPGVMYLPPLFKNEIESVESNDELIEENKLIGDAMQTSGSNSTTAANNREIRISNANTDLLFKLFENIEQKDKKSLQLQLQSQLKMHRLSTQKPVKTLSKALIKGEDPCIVDAVSEGLFPLLRLDSRSETVHYLAFKTNESTLNSLTSNGLSTSSPLISSNPSLSSAVNNLPMLQLEQNYAQELSDVVAAL